MPPTQTHLDVIQLFDIDLSKGRSLPDFQDVFPEHAESKVFHRFQESFDWLFDPQEDLGIKENGELDPTLHYLSQKVNCPYFLPRFDRFSLAADGGSSGDLGGVITISRELRVAVLTTWRRYTPPFDALKVKHELDTDIPQHYKEQLSKLFPNIGEAELMFPIISIRYDSSSIQEVLAHDGVRLGEVFSGGLDHETEATLRSYLEDNLSIRKYEALLIRSSDALAVYTSGTEDDAEADLWLYETTMFRAAQVCEVCLLARRIARTFKAQTDLDAKKVRLFPRPFLVEKRRSELLSLEKDIVKSLPFRSPEASPLIRKAQQKFDVPQLLGDAKDSYNFLESRYQNTKTTALAILGIVTYICDKMHFWDWISPFHPHK